MMSGNVLLVGWGMLLLAATAMLYACSMRRRARAAEALNRQLIVYAERVRALRAFELRDATDEELWRRARDLADPQAEELLTSRMFDGLPSVEDADV